MTEEFYNHFLKLFSLLVGYEPLLPTRTLSLDETRHVVQSDDGYLVISPIIRLVYRKIINSQGDYPPPIYQQARRNLFIL